MEEERKSEVTTTQDMTFDQAGYASRAGRENIIIFLHHHILGYLS